MIRGKLGRQWGALYNMIPHCWVDCLDLVAMVRQWLDLEKAASYLAVDLANLFDCLVDCLDSEKASYSAQDLETVHSWLKLEKKAMLVGLFVLFEPFPFPKEGLLVLFGYFPCLSFLVLSNGIVVRSTPIFVFRLVKNCSFFSLLRRAISM